MRAVALCNKVACSGERLLENLRILTFIFVKNGVKDSLNSMRQPIQLGNMQYAVPRGIFQESLTLFYTKSLNFPTDHQSFSRAFYFSIRRINPIIIIITRGSATQISANHYTTTSHCQFCF
jgi:hypothetical protein